MPWTDCNIFQTCALETIHDISIAHDIKLLQENQKM
jgi:hypothetical protein